MINPYDWKIHKRLIEATTVYIWPARGNDKTYTQLELYADMVTRKRNISVIRFEDIEKTIELLSKKPFWYDAFDARLYERFNDFNWESEK